MRILIIEDSFLWQSKIEVLLNKIDYSNYKFATNVNDAKTLFDEYQPNLIIADIILGNNTVFELYKKNKAMVKTPTIFVTALPNNENYKNAEQVEHFLFLSKSFTLNTFKSAVSLLASKYVNTKKNNTSNDKRIIQQQFNEVFKIIDDTKLLQKFNMDKFETEVIIQRLQNNKTFSEIGTEIGISNERVRTIFNRGFKKLKTKIINASERYTHFLEFTTLKKNILEINTTLTAKNNSVKKIAKEDYLKQNVDELKLLGTKWKNVLHEKQIHSIETLIKLNKKQLLLLPKFGQFAVSQIELELSKNGLTLKNN